MPRPRTPAGQLGTIQFTTLADGRIRARSRIRDDAGVIHPLKTLAATPDAALELLQRRAAVLSTGFEQLLSLDSTIAEACDVWLAEVRTSGRVEVSTLEGYQDSVRTVVVPACGAIRLRELSVGRADRILQRILATRSISAARKARAALSMVCGTAVRQDVLDFNPIRDVQRLPSSPKRQSYLSPVQIGIARALMHAWRTAPTDGPRPDARKLEDGMDIMIGTSARIGEILALRRSDVEITGSAPTLLIAATLVTTRQDGMRRKPTPKRARQTRRVTLPSFAAAAIRRRLASTGVEPDAYLFTTSTGRPYSVSNFERLLRSFVHDNENALHQANIVVDEFTTHIFRRTAATLVEQAGGITLASRLLGHSSEAVTRANYVVTPEQVDPVTAVILDDAIGRADG
ncbi:MAG: tyrosine-type recombinase/integrase [Acidobacteria bacterium]|nr:tyrosine-type recombinase/integrase [Acidobacteriota bacterium]